MEHLLVAKYKKLDLTYKYIKLIKKKGAWTRATRDLPAPELNTVKRHPKGVQHPNSKLTVELVREIYFSLEPPSIIGKRLGLSKGKIRGIRGRREWKSTTEGWGRAPCRATGRGQRVDILYKKGLL